MSRQALWNGYVQVMSALYEPEAFFKRLDDLYLEQKACFFLAMRQYFRRHPWRHLKAITKDSGRAAVLFIRLMSHIPEASLRREYRRRLFRVLKQRPDPQLIFIYAIKCAMHYHHYAMTRRMTTERPALVNSI
jgi:hypothetical protein